jgi:hypothetical protein
MLPSVWNRKDVQQNPADPRCRARRLVVICAFLGWAVSCGRTESAEHTGNAPARRQWLFHIAAGSLDSALLQFSRQTDTQVILSPRAPNVMVHGIQGRYTACEALDALLGSTGLVYTIVGNTVTVHPPAK